MKKVVSAHRTPDLMFEYAQNARKKESKSLLQEQGSRASAGYGRIKNNFAGYRCTGPITNIKWFDSLLSIVQMPGGVPVATTAIGKAGAINAGLLAIQMLSMYDLELEAKLAERRSMLAKTVIESSDQLG